MFRSPIELEVLAQAHRDDLQPRRTVSAAPTSANSFNGPVSRARRAMGHGLIALGERLSDRSPRPATPSAAALSPADLRAR